jgi:hypothetical protein
MQETNRYYKLADNIHKVLKAKITYVVLIGIFAVLTLTQMILFGLNI